MIRRIPMLAGCLFALSWITMFYALLMDWDTTENVDTIHIKGEIISLVHANGDWISMDIMLVDSILPHKLTRKLRLSWSKPPTVRVGQQWLFTIKPKPITGPLNQGGFNQQKYLLSKHIFAKGKVTAGRLLSDNKGVRDKLIEQLKPALAGYAAQDLLLALLVGERSLMTSDRWQQLRNTGTGHLFAISGLHLSVACLWIYLVSKTLLFNLLPTQGRRNSVVAMVLCAVTAIAYAYLAGFSVSTQRALIMLLTYISSWLFSRFSTSWERLLYALFMVLLLDPLSPLSASFWLSFTALIVILVTVGKFEPQRFEAVATKVESRQPAVISIPQVLLKQAMIGFRATLQWVVAFWAIQWRLALVLGGVQAIFFAGTSVISIAVNLILVPWFSFIVLPISLLSLLIFIMAILVGVDAELVNFFWLSQLTMEPVLMLLDIGSRIPFAWLGLSMQWIAVVICAVLGVWLCCQFRTLRWRLAFSVMTLPAVILAFQAIFGIQQQQWKVHLLDVGQGLSAVIERNGRAIIYDTGASFGANFSYAERIILPFLNSKGITKVDFLVISHADNDHAGGASVIMEAFPEAIVISDDKRWGMVNCRPKNLLWQAINLEIIGPLIPAKGNNGSCVIRFANGDNSLLLTGDIEHEAEQKLIHHKGIESDVMTAPHHGSRTSSSDGFINAVSPQLVLFPAGFNNRYGFPKKDILRRYHDFGIDTLISGEQGQVSVVFQSNSINIYTYRSDFAPFWYNQVFRFGENKNSE
ncbi:DNA internalization-related competence protein ComEC/Rec2 [Shewanella abyssi]|uniref:DNA internalization-related competence protein ComEC/Rec2 n=1 Tax=Shewanella abyssi TaxID=311789 RepID=UPI00200CAECB|nr:DNA internalization-related competence protein ComEC/Rec2 [Shewanella abyssi]MCL1049194.1 DNA internalization-related competence protein ComEC/Rec2 [Shewanella abyssi]